MEQAEAYSEADQKNTDTPLRKRQAYPDAFEAVWAGTGQRGGKSAAFKAWKKVGSIPWGELAVVWNCYMLSARVAKGYLKDLSGWFNGGYHEKDWSLEPANPKANAPTGPISWPHMQAAK